MPEYLSELTKYVLTHRVGSVEETYSALEELSRLAYQRGSRTWYVRLTQSALPPRLQEFKAELLDDREDALENAANRPDAPHKWSDTREAFSFVVTILKYRLIRLRVTVTRRNHAK